MGKRHREKRKQIKARLREVKGQLIKLDDHRRFEDEFGELKIRMTKAEARRRLLFRRSLTYASVEELLKLSKGAEYELFDMMSKNAVREIQEQEDRRVFTMLDLCAKEAVVDEVHSL